MSFPLSIVSENDMSQVLAPEGSRPRIALYSHDTQGLGHVRRNLLLASAFRGMGCDPVILLLSGARELGAFAIPPSVDCLTLPAFGKLANGSYFPRSLSVPMEDFTSLRRTTLTATLDAFDPDVLIVDKVPLGALGELEPAIRLLRSRGKTRMVLGLREILDDSESVIREWREGEYEAVIERYFDRMWVYGDRIVFDPVAEYGFSAKTSEKVRFTGYLNVRDAEPERLICDGEPVNEVRLPEGRLVLCEVGGGQDGAELARAFASASLPPGWAGVLVTGPLMPSSERKALRALVAARKDFVLLEFVTNCCALLAKAERVIAMGGYNTICEIMAYERRALIVPRVVPRTEQLIRARRLESLGLVDVLPPQGLSAAAIARWLATDRPGIDARLIDMGGVARLPGLLEEVLALPRAKEQARAAV
jgi:predicted glycosyltransferase